MRSFRRSIFCVLLSGLMLSNSYAEVSCPLADITKFAGDNCAAFTDGGKTSTANAQAGLNAGLNGLVRKVFGLEVSADAEVAKKVDEYRGPVQKDLNEYLSARESCREHFADKLIDLLCKRESEKKSQPEAILCTGEREGNCPGAHTLFLGCPNRSSEQILGIFCPSKRGNVIPIRTGISGNECGYSLLRLTCSD